MQLFTLAKALNLSCEHDATISSCSIDSRQIQKGGLFVALKGEHTDGHKFEKDDANKGAADILCKEKIADVKIPQLIVPDVAQALATLAKAYRSSFKIPIIALTGSNGKTSVKEMIYAILPKPAYATKGNLNNQLGVPLSILHLNENHTSAVFELGANHVGEIAYTANLVVPDVALINNIAPAHIGEFGSIENIAKTKGEIFASLKPNGFAIINADDAYANFWNENLKAKKVLRFSRKVKADVFADNINLDINGFASFNLHFPQATTKIKLRVPGIHNVSNALAAATCCYAINVPIQDIAFGLEKFSGVKGRLIFVKGMHESTIIDDTYNANLRSVLAAIKVLAQQPGKKILALGDMGELGPYASQHHKEVGEVAKNLNIDLLYTCGQYTKMTCNAFGKGAFHCKNQDEMISLISKQLDKNTTLLVKGSRLSAMEKVVAQLSPFLKPT